jgi:hypothetical protein
MEAIMGGAESLSQPCTRNRPYRCFLLRCWLEEVAGPGGEPVWRFAVRQVGPEAGRHSFTNFHEAAAFVEAELATCARGQKGDEGLIPGNQLSDRIFDQ